MVDVVDFVGEHMNKHQVEWKIVETPVDVYYCGLGVAKNAAGAEGLAERRGLRDAPPRSHRRALEEMVRHRNDQAGPGRHLISESDDRRALCAALTVGGLRREDSSMDYTFQFGQIWPYLPRLIDGAVLSLGVCNPCILRGASDRNRWCGDKTFGPTWARCRRQRICDLLHEHSSARPNLFSIFRAPRCRHPALVLRGRAAWHDAQRGGLSDRDSKGPAFSPGAESEMEAAEVLGFSRAPSRSAT